MNDFFQRLSSTGSTSANNNTTDNPAKAPHQSQSHTTTTTTGHHQPLNPNQGLRRIHVPPLLVSNNATSNTNANNVSRPSKMKLHLLPTKNDNDRSHHHMMKEEELSVTNLRKLYSSLLEEMAPLHHASGSGDGSGGGTKSGSNGSGGKGSNNDNNANYRWKNSGTITVHGSDDEGYDYSYTPDDTQRSWRLQTLPGPGVPSSSRGGGGGITGGDWSKDGIRRYHTGGTLFRGGGGGSSSNIISVGGMDVDVGTMNGVEISPPKKTRNSAVVGAAGDGDGTDVGTVGCGGGTNLDVQFSIDDDDDDDGSSKEIMEHHPDGCEEEMISFEDDPHPPATAATSDDPPNRGIANSISSMEDIKLDASDSHEETTNPLPTDNNEITSNPPFNPFNNDLTITTNTTSFSPTNSNISNNTTTTTSAFESLYHLSPLTAWRLRSAYSPKTPLESHLLHHAGSELLAQRANTGAQADGIMAGLEVAKVCESKVCDGLARLGRLVSYCERKKGVALDEWKQREEIMEKEEDEEDEGLEEAEAVFAYFCEKNVLPMLIDSLLCHPPPLTSSSSDENPSSSNKIKSDNNNSRTNANTTTTIGSSPSPFSGVCWTSSVKSQILSTIAMILFNTSSPLSLTYLLSNNYMNELIMGMLPLDQWKEGESGLEEILPPYVTLLRGLVMRLRGKEIGMCCLPLFLCQRPVSGGRGRRSGGVGKVAQEEKNEEEEGTTETYLPLLYAAVQVFCSPIGTSLRDSEGCLVRTTAMNVILNLCRITDPEVRLVLVQGGGGGGGGDYGVVEGESLPTTKSVPSVMPQSPSSSISRPLTIEQEMLFPHICNSLNSWFHRSVRLVMASLSLDSKHHQQQQRQQQTSNPKPQQHHGEARAEAKARHDDLASMQFRELQYWLGFLDDLLSCEIRAWNARLVEWVMREVVVGTVLLRWNRALRMLGGCGGSDGSKVKVLLEVYKARAEARVAMVFLTQLFGMVEYSPLIRLVGAVVLHQNYPCAWFGAENDNINFAKEGDGFFVVTPAVNAMICDKSSDDDTVGVTVVSSGSGEEADAGAGSRPKAAASSDGTQIGTDGTQATNGKNEGSPAKRGSSSGKMSPVVNEMEHRALETVAKEHNCLQFAEEVEHNYSGEQHTNTQFTPIHQELSEGAEHNRSGDRPINQQYTPNKQHAPNRQRSTKQQYAPNQHRAALLDMMSGDDVGTYSSDETILASMLLATILENDAIDDRALELFAVLPSPRDSIQLSPFETSIARCLSRDWSTVDSNSRVSKAIECVSSLGMMLLERTIFHTWTEGGQCMDAVPFDHYYKSSKFVQALGMSLSYFASQAQSYLPDAHATREIFLDLIRKRYSSVDAPDSPRFHDESVKMMCSLQNYYPSNFIDNAGVLTGDFVHDDSSTKPSSSGDLHLFHDENEGAKFALQLTLHLRSILACIQNLYERLTLQNSPLSIANSRWHGEGESLSFSTTEEADDILLSIGGIGMTRLPEVGTNIGLRGRKFFRCSLPRKSKFGRSFSFDIFIDASGTRITVTEKTDLVLVVDPTEIYIGNVMKDDSNRCMVLAVVPLRVIIASATEGELLHIVCNANEKTTGLPAEILKNGTLSLRFGHSFCASAKECLDKHHQAYETKVVMDMADMLQKCSHMASERFEAQSNEADDSWCDFQQA